MHANLVQQRRQLWQARDKSLQTIKVLEDVEAVDEGLSSRGDEHRHGTPVVKRTAGTHRSGYTVQLASPVYLGVLGLGVVLHCLGPLLPISVVVTDAVPRQHHQLVVATTRLRSPYHITEQAT